jgi:F420-dependent oxidoreductase-like protein
MRFGIQTAQQHVPFEQMRDCWQRAEALGFDIAYVFDHFIPIFSDEDGPCLECFTTLTALACATERIRIGTLVVGNTYRNPALLANTCATLDIVSGGRLELGIGAGWFEREHRAYGYEFPPIGRRIRMMEEAIHVIRALCTEQAPAFKGRYYELNDARLEPKPVQKPCFPIFVGGRGEKLTLAAVARAADGWNIIGASADEFRQKMAALSEHCERERRDLASIHKSVALTVRPDGRRILNSETDELTDLIGQLREDGADEVIFSIGPRYDYEALERVAREVMPAFR